MSFDSKHYDKYDDDRGYNNDIFNKHYATEEGKNKEKSKDSYVKSNYPASSRNPASYYNGEGAYNGW